MKLSRSEPCKLRKKLLDRFKCSFKAAIKDSVIKDKETGFVILEVDFYSSGTKLARTFIDTGEEKSIAQPWGTWHPKKRVASHFHSHKEVRNLRELRPSCSDIKNMINKKMDYTCVGGKSKQSGEYGLSVFVRPTNEQIIKIHKRVIHIMYQYESHYSPPEEMKPDLLNANIEQIKLLLIEEEMTSGMAGLTTNEVEKFMYSYKERWTHNFGYAGNRCNKVVFR